MLWELSMHVMENRNSSRSCQKESRRAYRYEQFAQQDKNLLLLELAATSVRLVFFLSVRFYLVYKFRVSCAQPSVQASRRCATMGTSIGMRDRLGDRDGKLVFILKANILKQVKWCKPLLAGEMSGFSIFLEWPPRCNAGHISSPTLHPQPTLLGLLILSLHYPNEIQLPRYYNIHLGPAHPKFNNHVVCSTNLLSTLSFSSV